MRAFLSIPTLLWSEYANSKKVYPTKNAMSIEAFIFREASTSSLSGYAYEKFDAGASTYHNLILYRPARERGKAHLKDHETTPYDRIDRYGYDLRILDE